ncbi:hypothetical protein D3C81_1211010 [compost metagenome]
MLLDVVGTCPDQLGGTRQTEEPQAAAHRLQAGWHVGQVELVAIGFQIGGNGTLGQSQTGLSLVHDHDMRLEQLVRGERLAIALPVRLRRAHLALALIALLQSRHHAFHIEQGIGQTQQFGSRRIVAALDPGTDRRHLRLQGIGRRTQADHAERLGQLADLRMQLDLALHLRSTALDQVEDILDSHQLFANGQRQRAHDLLTRAAQAPGLLVQQVVGKRQRGQPEHAAHLAGALALAAGQGHQVQQLLEQAARRLELRIGQQLPQIAVDARQQLLARLGRAQLRLGHGLQRRSADPAQPRTLTRPQQIIQTAQRARHQLQRRAQVLLAQDVHQAQLIHLAQPGAVAVRHAGLDLHIAPCGARLIQADAEEIAFRQARLPGGLAQLVDHRQ